MDERKVIEERNDSFKLIRMMEEHVTDWPWCVELEDDKELVRFEHNAAFDDLWQRHLAVSDCPWWSRMWTVQEALLPPRASVMHDTWSMSFEDLVRLGKTALITHHAGCCQDVLGIFPDEVRVKLAFQVNQYTLLKAYLDALRQPGERIGLTECLVHHGHRQCLDPRDKVYGVLGLIKGYTGLTKPAGRCVGTIATICQESCPLALQFAEVYSAFKSWLDIAGFDYEAHAAGRHTETNERIWRTMLCGVARDRNVLDASKGAGWRRFHSDDMKLLAPFAAFARTGVAPTLDKMPLSARTIPMSASLRTYFRSRDGGHGLCYPTSRPNDQVWVLHGGTVPFVLRPVHVDTSIEANVLRPYNAFLRDKDHRRIGIKEGCFEPRTGHYQLIGDCYYDGFMDGEALNDQKYPPEPILLI